MNKKQMSEKINGLASEYQGTPTVMTGLEQYSRPQLLATLRRFERMIELKRQADAIAIGYNLNGQRLFDLEARQPDWYLRIKALRKEARELWKGRYHDRKNF